MALSSPSSPKNDRGFMYYLRRLPEDLKALDIKADAAQAHFTFAKEVMGLLDRKNLLPKVSKFERIMLNAGTPGLDQEMVNGNPDWESFFQYDVVRHKPEEQSFLDNEIEELCAMIDRDEIQRTRKIPEKLLDFMAKTGMYALEVEKEPYGGRGFSTQLHKDAIRKVASRNEDVAVVMMVMNSLGTGEMIRKEGTPEQKKRWLRDIARGLLMTCFGLTEPNAGSDANAVEGEGTIYRGEDGRLKIRMDFEKRYITLGPIMDLGVVAVKLKDPENLLDGACDSSDSTAVIIERGMPGLEAGNRHDPLGANFPNGPLRGRGVCVDLEQYVVGGRAGVGKGFDYMAASLAVGRNVSLPSLAYGTSQRVFAAVTAYGGIRDQFRREINRFQMSEARIGRMAAEMYAMRAAQDLWIQSVQNGEKPAVGSAMLKLHMTNQAARITEMGMDILGGKGIMEGPKNIVADIHKRGPISKTVEGANPMMQGVVTGGQLVVLCHKLVSRVFNAKFRKDPREGMRDFFAGAARLAGQTAKNLFVMAPLLGMTGGIGTGKPRNLPAAKAVDPSTRRYYRRVKRMARALNVVSNVATMLLRDRMKEQQYTSSRIGDVNAHLDFATASLWMYEKGGRRPEEKLFVHGAARIHLKFAEKALDKALENFPVPGVGLLMRPFLFPRAAAGAGLAVAAGAALAASAPVAAAAALGAGAAVMLSRSRLRGVSDAMLSKMAQAVCRHGPEREVLLHGMYRPRAEHEPLAMMEKGLGMKERAVAISASMVRAHKKNLIDMESKDAFNEAAARGIITPKDLAFMKEWKKLKDDVIAVDEYAPGAMPGVTPPKAA